jgi:D-serine deaminase-like pyridoxal phosphate-dependent protein
MNDGKVSGDCLKVEELSTPALLVDLDAMEANLHEMASFFANTAARLRPHFKNHKCPMLARKQIRAGAIGMTCATVREAEILVHHGVDSVLIANEPVGETKAKKIAELSGYASVIVAVDSVAGVKDLARAQSKAAPIEVVVDVNIGLDRCGVEPGEPARQLAKLALEQGLAVRGIMGYDGHLQVLPQTEERVPVVRAGSKALVDTAELIRAAGIPVDIISTGGTGTYGISGLYPGITELQAGSYLLMDDLYLERGSRFQRSLTVLTTFISKQSANQVVIDCGVKAISGERGLPQAKTVVGTRLKALHAEHGLLQVDTSAVPTLEIGQKVELWVRYSDATMNLHTFLYGVRHGEVEEIFRIEH